MTMKQGGLREITTGHWSGCGDLPLISVPVLPESARVSNTPPKVNSKVDTLVHPWALVILSKLYQ